MVVVDVDVTNTPENCTLYCGALSEAQNDQYSDATLLPTPVLLLLLVLRVLLLLVLLPAELVSEHTGNTPVYGANAN